MKVAVVFNRESKKVINILGMQNQEKYGKEAITRVVNALKNGGHQVATFEGDKDLIDNLEDFMPRVVAGERPGMVFNLAYGVQGQARYTHVPGILEMVGLPYVGSGPMAHSLALDKVVAKMMFVQHGLPTPAFAVLETPDFEMPEVPFPLIVKPRNEAMSFGLKIVHSETELRDAAQVIFDEFRQPVLVEQFIAGREVNVGLLGNNPIEALPPAELVFGAGGPQIYTVEDKRGSSGRTVEVQCPASLGEELTQKAQDVAKAAFRALGCLDCARVDMRLDDQGSFYILEINSLPSLGEHGSFVHGAAAVGLDFPALINRLVDLAATRYFGTPMPPQVSTPEGQKKDEIFSHITSRRDRLESRLKDWTQLSSRSLDPIGLRNAQQKLDKAMTRLDLRRVEEFTDAPEVATWETAKGFEGGTLLIGHLDVPLPAEPSTPQFRREPEWLYGEGIACSRAPLVMMESALAALRRIRKLRHSKLGVLYYSDEGQDCALSEEMIRAAAAMAKRVLVLRPGNPGDRVVHERRGSRRYELQVRGPNLRLGQAREGRGELMRWLSPRLDACIKLGDRKARIAVNFSEIRSQALPMLLPHELRISLVISFPDDAQADRVEVELRKILVQNKDGIRAQLERVAHRPAMPDSKVNKILRKDLKTVATEWDIPFGHESSLLPSVAGLIPKGTAVLCGVGPAGQDTYTTHEAVQRISLVQRSLLLAQYLEGLCS